MPSITGVILTQWNHYTALHLIHLQNGNIACESSKNLQTKEKQDESNPASIFQHVTPKV